MTVVAPTKISPSYLDDEKEAFEGHLGAFQFTLANGDTLETLRPHPGAQNIFIVADGALLLLAVNEDASIGGTLPSGLVTSPAANVAGHVPKDAIPLLFSMKNSSGATRNGTVLIR